MDDIERGVNMKVICESCETVFRAETVRGMSSCPVCGAAFSDFDMFSAPQKEKTKWYYYKEGGGTLMDTMSSSFTPLYTFEAVDMEDAERQLKEVLPNSPLLRDNADDKVRCPYCFSSEIQLVPRKFSLLTGFATNKFDRVCIRCKKRF